jgi:DNA polymerase-3 subunit delta
MEDLNAVVGRTRQEALFELTQAIGEKKLDQALLIVTRLQENSIHYLAILATLRNFTRTLLLFRCLQEQAEYGVRPNMPANLFQQQCLPVLKQNERWQKELSGHPYAMYMQFKTASVFSLATLKSWLSAILTAEMRLKGSSIDPNTVLEHLILSMLAPDRKGNLQNRHGALH